MNGDIANTNGQKNTRQSSKGHKHDRRGAATIIAGVLVVAILISTVFVYFLTIQQGESTRSKAEVNSMQLKSEKANESFKVRSFELLVGGRIQLWINNTGSAPIRVLEIAVYDQGSIPSFNDLSGGLTINAGISQSIDTEFVVPDINRVYRIDVITERGNILSTTWPPPSDDINITEITKIAEFATQTLIAQGLGSIQLDFNSFGQILPSNQTQNNEQFWLTKREGTDQTGWHVKASGAPGYPAFRMMKDLNTYLVLKVRNMDASGEDIKLFHDSGLVLSLTKDQNTNQNTPVYLCNATETAASVTVSGYDETVPNRTILLPNAASPLIGKDELWVDLFFCDANVSRGTGANFASTWSAKIPANTVPINPTFLIARGEFSDSHRQYGQTIPYQAVTITDNYDSTFIACLKSSSVNQATPDCKSTTSDDYQAPQSLVNSTAPTPYRVNLKLTCIHVGCGGTGPLNTFTVDWIYPDGRYRSLVEDATADTSTNNIALDLPQFMADDTTPIKTGYYAIQVTDFNDQVYYMTFRVTNG